MNDFLDWFLVRRPRPIRHEQLGVLTYHGSVWAGTVPQTGSALSIWAGRRGPSSELLAAVVDALANLPLLESRARTYLARACPQEFVAWPLVALGGGEGSYDPDWIPQNLCELNPEHPRARALLRQGLPTVELTFGSEAQRPVSVIFVGGLPAYLDG